MPTAAGEGATGSATRRAAASRRRRRPPRDISVRRQRFHCGLESGGTTMSLTTRRTILKGLVGGGAAAAVSGFPFVYRLALGQQSLKLGVVVPMTGPMALEAQEMLAATQIAVEDVHRSEGRRSETGSKEQRVRVRTR